ncbi:hypothetical protein [Paraflavitalea pollutisoli]|uniref:hypothetical protein n=1 Tax=Paraflavitalea pollutisoli TaxID=3034143 RepID=UPI0023EAA5B5|nr:hypothetical protein [Paraflavitalea sp. H1-2-19X]
MKKLIALLLLMSPALLLLAQVDTSGAHPGTVAAQPIEDDTWLIYMGMVLILGFATALILGLLATGAVAAILAGLTFAGILSVSVITGLYRKSVYAGFKAFVYLCFCVVGAAGVSLMAIMTHSYGNTGYPLKKLLTWGIPAGILGGLSCGWVVLLILKRLYEYLSMKLNRSQA